MNKHRDSTDILSAPDENIWRYCGQGTLFKCKFIHGSTHFWQDFAKNPRNFRLPVDKNTRKIKFFCRLLTSFPIET